MCTSEAKFIINSTIGAICAMIVNELYKEKQNNVLLVYCNLRQFASFWLILYTEWYRYRETELFVTVTVRLMDGLVNNSLYLRWLLYLLCSLYSLIIFSIYVCIHIHYNSVENSHWQKLAETCFCWTGLNRGLNHLRQKLANPEKMPSD